MNEQFDHDLREAMKQGPGGSLKGLEFTPAMRQRVLDRIRTETPGSAVPPSGSVRTVPRPLLWAAVAAAAMVIAIRIDGVQSFLGFQSSASKSSSPMMAGSAKQPRDMKAESTAAAPAMPAPAPARTAQPGQDQSAARSPSTESTSGSAGAAASIQSSAAASFISLSLPSAHQDAASKTAAAPAAAAPAPSLSMKAVVNWGGLRGAGSRILLVGEGAAAAYDSAGQRLWQADLPGASPTSAAALTEDGRSAVGGAENVYLLTANGEVERRVSVTGPVTGLAYGPDGRLAVIAGNRLSLYQSGETELLAEGVVAAEVRFRSDNAIALLATASGQRTLRLWDAQGSLLFERPVQGGGRGLAITSGGQILAGGTIFDSRGRVVTALPVDPLGIEAPQGAPYAILWTGDQVMAVNPDGGAVLWRARWEGGGAGIHRVAVGRESGSVAVAGALEQGGGIFVLSESSGEVRLAERLSAPPTGVQLTGSRLFLTIDGRLDERQIGP